MNTKQTEALKLALEALEQLQGGCTDSDDGTYEAITVWCPEVIDAIREALAQPEQEPVAMYEDWYNPNSCGHCGMVGGHTKICRHYTTPQPRQWQGLTDEEIEGLLPTADGSAEENKVRVEVQPGIWGVEYEEVDAWSLPLVRQAIRAIEAKLREKNT